MKSLDWPLKIAPLSCVTVLNLVALVQTYLRA